MTDLCKAILNDDLLTLRQIRVLLATPGTRQEIAERTGYLPNRISTITKDLAGKGWLHKEGKTWRTEYKVPKTGTKKIPKTGTKKIPKTGTKKVPESGSKIVEIKPDESVEVFDFWKQTMKHPRSRLDHKRKAIILKWLKVYTKEDLKQAIHGCSVTPFNMGDNDRGQRYDSLNVILKDGDQIDRFMANAENPPAGKVKTIEQTQQESRAQAERVRKHLFGG